MRRYLENCTLLLRIVCAGGCGHLWLIERKGDLNRYPRGSLITVISTDPKQCLRVTFTKSRVRLTRAISKSSKIQCNLH